MNLRCLLIDMLLELHWRSTAAHLMWSLIKSTLSFRRSLSRMFHCDFIRVTLRVTMRVRVWMLRCDSSSIETWCCGITHRSLCCRCSLFVHLISASGAYLLIHIVILFALQWNSMVCCCRVRWLQWLLQTWESWLWILHRKTATLLLIVSAIANVFVFWDDTLGYLFLDSVTLICRVVMPSYLRWL